MKLTEYMKKAEQIYKDAAAEYIKVAQKYRQTQDDIQEVRGSAEYTPEGKTKRIKALEDYRAKLKTELNKLANEADSQAMKIRADVEKRFYNAFHATPAALDMAAIELLKSGILTDNELLTLAGSFKGNATMQRICGTYMEKSNNAEVQRMGRAMRYTVTDPHMRCFDSVITAGRACVGIGTQTGADGAETFLKRYDQMTAEAYAAAPDVEG